MPHPIWQGTLGFGLVEIPVNLRSAEKSDQLEFSLLDKRDLSPIGYRKVNKSTGREVPNEEIVKGFEHKKGKYVLLTESDFRSANLEATRMIEVEGFVDA